MNDPKANLDRFIQYGFKKSLQAGLLGVATAVEVIAKKECPVDDGTLRADITSAIDKDKLEAIVGNNVEYAPYVHQGTGIFAKEGNGRQAPWVYQSADGKWHTTKGQKPNLYLQRAIDTVAPVAGKFFVQGAETEWKN